MRLASLTATVRALPSWTVGLALASAVAFLALATLVGLGMTRGVDLATTIAFQSVASDPLDLLANVHTVLGQLVVTLAVAAALGLVTWRRLGGYAWLGPALILATGGVELVFKFVLQHPGPSGEYVRAFHNTLGIRLESPSSFPSGHIARLAFLALVVVALFPGRLTWVLGGAFVALTLFLRVYIGDHWISDALAGLALGAGGGAAAVVWMRATARRGAVARERAIAGGTVTSERGRATR